MWILTIATIYLVHGTTFALPYGNKLTSANFPNMYPNNEDTVQTLSVPGGYNMLITFQEFELETHGFCGFDYVSICDGNNLCGKKLCGSLLPDPITVSTSNATVVFHSDGSVSRKGFSLTYKKIRPEVAAFSIDGGPSAIEGNVFFGGRPICADYWDNTDAGVFCRMLGYQNGNATSGSKYGQVSSNFSMDDVQCNGHETNLIDCNHTTQHNCGSSEGAGVICSVDDLDLLERNEPGGVGSSNTRPTVLHGLVRDGELSEIMTNHLRLDLHPEMQPEPHVSSDDLHLVAVVHAHDDYDDYDDIGLFTSVASSLEPVTATTTESSSTITTDTEWDHYIKSLSMDWEPDYMGPEIIDAMACSGNQMLDGEECVPDPTYCPTGKVFDGQGCVYDPRNCPYGYFVEDGKCERDPSILIIRGEFESIMISQESCRCRQGYHFSVRRRSEESPNGSCIRCRRRTGGRNRCGC